LEATGAQMKKLFMNLHFFLECVEAGTAKSTVSDEELTLCLGDVFQFVTGSRTTPAEGFDITPSIDFDHTAGENRFPTANTCTCTLMLSICSKMKSEDDSLQMFVQSIIEGQMFGLI
jgi:hypothetical protein